MLKTQQIGKIVSFYCLDFLIHKLLTTDGLNGAVKQTEKLTAGATLTLTKVKSYDLFGCLIFVVIIIQNYNILSAQSLSQAN